MELRFAAVRSAKESSYIADSPNFATKTVDDTATSSY